MVLLGTVAVPQKIPLQLFQPIYYNNWSFETRKKVDWNIRKNRPDEGNSSTKTKVICSPCGFQIALFMCPGTKGDQGKIQETIQPYTRGSPESGANAKPPFLSQPARSYRS